MTFTSPPSPPLSSPLFQADSSNTRARSALVVRPQTCPPSASRLGQPLARALARGSPAKCELKSRGKSANCAEESETGKVAALQPDSHREEAHNGDFLRLAEQDITHLERAASAQSMRSDCRFNFNTLKHDLALGGLDNLSRSYSLMSSTDSSLLRHRQRAVNVRRSKQQPAIGPTLLSHGCAVHADEAQSSASGEVAGSKNRDGFTSAYNRYVLASCGADKSQGLGGECSRNSRTLQGHLHALDCIVPLLPPAHAADTARALSMLRVHLFAAGHSYRQGEEHGAQHLRSLIEIV
jgi:hypothetical protein